MSKLKKGDIVEWVGKPDKKYQIIDIADDWYCLQSLQSGVHGVLKSDSNRMMQAQQTLFSVGDKLRYKIALIDLTFEVIAIKDGEYFLKSSKGEEVRADYFHVHEVLEVFE